MGLLATSTLFTPYVPFMIAEIIAKNPSIVGETKCETRSDAGSTILSVGSVRLPVLPTVLTGTLKTIARLNRNTTWVAMGLLAPVVFAAVMVAVRDSHPKTNDLTDVPAQIKSDALPNANPVAVSKVTDSIEKNTDEIISGQAKSVDFGITPQTNQDHHAAQAIESSRASPQPGFVRVVRPKIPQLAHRPRIPRSVSVKARLLALWHLNLVQKKALAVGPRSSNSAKKKAVTSPKEPVTH
jgi:hypothetical protein